MKQPHNLSILFALALGACGGKSKGDTMRVGGEGVGGAARTDDATPAADPHVALVDAELTAYERARPMFASYCGGCHIQGGAEATTKKLEHVDMTSYPFTGHHVDTITTTIGHVLGVDGAKPTMPKDKPGSVKPEDLAVIPAWIAAYDDADDGGAHVAGEGHHDDDDDHDD